MKTLEKVPVLLGRLLHEARRRGRIDLDLVAFQFQSLPLSVNFDLIHTLSPTEPGKSCGPYLLFG